MAEHLHTNGTEYHDHDDGHSHDHEHEHSGGNDHVHDHEYDHDHEHDHDHDHDHTHDHEHDHDHSPTVIDGRKRIRVKVSESPGLVFVDRQIHDEAITISAAMTIISDDTLLNEHIAGEIETAAREITKRGGIVGHIKASVSTTTTCMITAADETAMIKESPMRRARITLAAIVFLVDPEEAENIIREALAGIRAHMMIAS